MKPQKISCLLLIAMLFVSTNSLSVSSQSKGTYEAKPTDLSAFDDSSVFYLDLPNENFASYTAPSRNINGSKPITIKSVFKKVRFDPWTLKIHTGDWTHATNTGYINHYKPKPDRVPFGTAFGCEGTNKDDGIAKIDLRGTPYAVSDKFTNRGYMSAGSVKVSENGQVVDLRGGGYCGWIAPDEAKNETQAHEGGWYIQLVLLNKQSDIFTDSKGNTYLNLKYPNTSGYKKPTRSSWKTPSDTDLIVTWNKLRIEPDTLRINTADWTYTTATGHITHNVGFYDKNAFGAAQGCDAPNKADGVARIDLRGTKYRVKEDFVFQKTGSSPAGSAILSENRQVVDIRGGGYCGWMGLLKGEAGFKGGWVDGFLEKIE